MNLIDWPFRDPEAVDDGALTFRELRRFNKAVYPAVWLAPGSSTSVERRCCRGVARRSDARPP